MSVQYHNIIKENIEKEAIILLIKTESFSSIQQWQVKLFFVPRLRFFILIISFCEIVIAACLRDSYHKYIKASNNIISLANSQ